jgi:hypothetical protein
MAAKMAKVDLSKLPRNAVVVGASLEEVKSAKPSEDEEQQSDEESKMPVSNQTKVTAAQKRRLKRIAAKEKDAADDEVMEQSHRQNLSLALIDNYKVQTRFERVSDHIFFEFCTNRDMTPDTLREKLLTHPTLTNDADCLMIDWIENVKTIVPNWTATRDASSTRELAGKARAAWIRDLGIAKDILRDEKRKKPFKSGLYKDIFELLTCPGTRLVTSVAFLWSFNTHTSKILGWMYFQIDDIFEVGAPRPCGECWKIVDKPLLCTDCNMQCACDAKCLEKHSRWCSQSAADSVLR